MLKKLLKLPELKSAIKKFSQENAGVWDVVLYGSAVRGKEDVRDVDFAVLLSGRMPVGRKLSLAQELKESVEKAIPAVQVDVKTADLDDLFDVHFLARQGIIAEGYLIMKEQYLAESLGFKTFAFIQYSLKGLTYSQKKMLYYALKGRRGSKGVLTRIGGELLSREILKVPMEASYKIEELLTMHKVKFTIESAMVYRKR